MSFSQKILVWYRQNKRSLPWRSTKDPYRIWLSEIILQQTRVAQGTPYYNRFVEVFPKVQDMANASEETILKLWQGLGYYSRARNLHATAKLVTEKYDGKFPGSYKELLTLKGVGDYTASAISSISYGEKQAVVDGNVYRVLARYYGIDIPINSTEGIKYFKTLAEKVMDADDIRDYNQGIMEFGAIQCTPKNPNCMYCPLNESCKALQNGTVLDLPVKLKKAKVRNRYFNYLVPVHISGNGEVFTLINKRTGKGIWQNLWEFPLIEKDGKSGKINMELVVKNKLALNYEVSVRLFNEQPIIHKLSHQHLYTHFWIVENVSHLDNMVNWNTLQKYPVPVLIADFIKAFKI